MSRWIKFLIAIGLGAAGGLLYGWVINPVEYVDIAPDSLRQDYKADYVLMVAEAYQVEDDLSLAVRRLALLGDTPPSELVGAVMNYAVEHEYPDSDLALLQALSLDVQAYHPQSEVPAP